MRIRNIALPCAISISASGLVEFEPRCGYSLHTDFMGHTTCSVKELVHCPTAECVRKAEAIQHEGRRRHACGAHAFAAARAPAAAAGPQVAAGELEAGPGAG